MDTGDISPMAIATATCVPDHQSTLRRSLSYSSDIVGLCVFYHIQGLVTRRASRRAGEKGKMALGCCRQVGDHAS